MIIFLITHNNNKLFASMELVLNIFSTCIWQYGYVLTFDWIVFFLFANWYHYIIVISLQPKPRIFSVYIRDLLIVYCVGLEELPKICICFVEIIVKDKILKVSLQFGLKGFKLIGIPTHPWSNENNSAVKASKLFLISSKALKIIIRVVRESLNFWKRFRVQVSL